MALEDGAREHHVPIVRLGETGGPRMVLDTLFEATVAQAREAYESALPRFMESSAAQASA
jgi:hypothetical protein